MRRLLLLVTITLTACAYHPDRAPEEAHAALQDKPAAEKEAAVEIPAAVAEYLTTDVEATNAGKALLEEPRFSINANDVDVREFLKALAANAPQSLVIHPEVKGSVSLSLKDVTLDEALEVLSDVYGYQIRKSNRVVQVLPAGMRTETFALDYLALRRMGFSQTEVSAGGVRDQQRNGNNGNNYNNGNQNSGFGNPLLGNQSGNNSGSQQQRNQMQGNGTSISSQTETDLWANLEDILEGVVGKGEGRRVIVAPQAGLVSITAYPDELRAAKDFLKVAEKRLQRQVILEARIIEVTLNDEYQQGINWSDALSAMGGNLSYRFTGNTPTNATSAALGGIFGIAFTDQNFSGLIELLQTQGNVQVLSSPRVSAANNQKAVIKVGEDEYFVTDVSTTTVTGTATTTSPNIDLTPFFSGIALDVTPQISDSGEVILHVHPAVVETSEQEKVITLNEDQFVLPLAQSNIRESDTIVRAHNGEIVVLGGLMQTTYSEMVSKAPLLGDIPLLGELFKNRRNVEKKKELVILLKPTVVGADTWQQEVQKSDELLKKWFPEQ
ncbi:pilus (MSHA type) biogenesis protein MshL [Idiomarina tyrosinivorans]|uniref:Pilus (MSHA type) biogenesis protein MshL n=1 Tax=Idiomarina tyrosinivorans TaxID=1445662 RepID=A0A432ZQI3_9GAMM|nr:pilus (MSHA type) biogenesis protein MshL [Idiomarina tyrosinivorans]RUO80143.1 pilus (MSHA type) biogenesis protein MshL [Idiomarina tyrosinivorans]